MFEYHYFTMNNTQPTTRTVHLPLPKFDKCSQCGTKSGLRLCSSCGERIYCSSNCQKADWKDHKKICGITERIDLGTYWPFLAYMAELCHVNKIKPSHPALHHVIANKPVPNKCHVLPDGSATNLVLLGDPLPTLEHTGGPLWWPSAPSEEIRSKFLLRICREGFTLPIVFSICIALLAEMYTTTVDPSKESQSRTGEGSSQNSNQRFRLQCERGPIADFGICKGSIDIKPRNTLSYVQLDDTHPTPTVDFIKGQDPNDHYWFYFKTVKGEEFILDLCMFTFNFPMVISSGEPYRPPRPPFPPLNLFAGLFINRELRRNAPVMHFEKKRFSVLQNKALQSTVRRSKLSDLDEKILVGVMERIAGRKSNKVEQGLLIIWVCMGRLVMSMNLSYKDYLGYPQTVPIGNQFDPREIERESRQDSEDAFIYLKKWRSRQGKGLITSEQLYGALKKWNGLPPEEKVAYKHQKSGSDRRKNARTYSWSQ